MPPISVSMHLMVLGASRLLAAARHQKKCYVSMHLMVLGASRLRQILPRPLGVRVSMHLMVLGASRPLGVLPVVPPGETGPGSPLA